MGNIRNLERVREVTCKTYEEAVRAKSDATKQPVHKVKIFARPNGTYDVVHYKKIGDELQKKVEELGEQIKAGGPRKTAQLDVVHGQKSKDRKVNLKKKMGTK